MAPAHSAVSDRGGRGGVIGKRRKGGGQSSPASLAGAGSAIIIDVMRGSLLMRGSFPLMEPERIVAVQGGDEIVPLRLLLDHALLVEGEHQAHEGDFDTVRAFDKPIDHAAVIAVIQPGVAGKGFAPGRKGLGNVPLIAGELCLGGRDMGASLLVGGGEVVPAFEGVFRYAQRVRGDEESQIGEDAIGAKTHAPRLAGAGCGVNPFPAVLSPGCLTPDSGP